MFKLLGMHNQEHSYLSPLPADTGFAARWIEGHNLAAAAFGKPLLLEEFGNIAMGNNANITRVRDPLYRCAVQHLVQARRGLATSRPAAMPTSLARAARCVFVSYLFLNPRIIVSVCCRHGLTTHSCLMQYGTRLRAAGMTGLFNDISFWPLLCLASVVRQFARRHTMSGEKYLVPQDQCNAVNDSSTTTGRCGTPCFGNGCRQIFGLQYYSGFPAMMLVPTQLQ